MAKGLLGKYSCIHFACSGDRTSSSNQVLSLLIAARANLEIEMSQEQYTFIDCMRYVYVGLRHDIAQQRDRYQRAELL